MKKLISTILALSLIFTTMAFSSLTANASSTTYDYGTLLYEENFDSTTLNTTLNTLPKWVIGTSYTITNGILTPAGAMNVNFMQGALAPTNGEKLVLEMRMNISKNSTTNWYPFSLALKDVNNTTKTGFSAHVYSANRLIQRNKGTEALINPIDFTKWYDIKLIYDPADGKWDTLTNGKCMLRDTVHEVSLNSGLSQISFVDGINIDYIKVYSTKNVVSLDFDEAKEEGSFYSAKITKTNGDVRLATEDGNGCLLVEQNSTTNETTSLELSIPSVYATTDKPYIVAEGRFKNTGGNNTQLMVLGSTAAVTAPSAHQVADVRQYSNFFYVIDNTNQQGTNKVKENYNGDSWVFVQIIVNTTNPANVTFDVVVDGVLVQNDLVAQATSSDNINKITFSKNTAGASKLFVDYVNVYNATEPIVSDILYQGETAYTAGESATLTAVVKDNSGAEISGKNVTYALKESYDGVSISDSTITVAESAQTGLFTVVASTQANGVEYSEEIDMRVVSSENPYKVLSSSVTNTAVSFTLADVSPSGADLWSAIAVYNSDTSLKKVIIRTPSFKNHVWSDSVSLSSVADSDDLVKVFFWNSLSNMKPYFAELNN